MSEDTANPVQRVNRASQVWPDHVRSVIAKSRGLHAEKATRISPSAMLEVLSALDGYFKEIESSDLGEMAKSIHWQGAECFVRWMQGEFVPGSREAPYRKRVDRGNTPATL
jgi:hypothetical protein